MDKKAFIAWARRAAVKYEPSEAAAAQLSGVELVALVGPTGAGKTTIIDALGLPVVKSDMTRQPRADGIDNDTSIFRADYAALRSEIESGQYVQFLVSRSGEFYGTRAASYPRMGPCVMAIVAEAVPFFEHFGFAVVHKLYITPPDYSEWMRRIAASRPKGLDGRMKEAEVSMRMALSDPTYQYILSDDISTAAADVRMIVEGGEPLAGRQQAARDALQRILKRLG